ncbi:polyprenyl synthetase family protein [Bremerella sp. T1]|uniref:polyprenyl synthetase family protein n=1 Tax=Bremerella sp. TYQ1 TaxID=3119568 RepID=UPI001CCC246E|nr:polyprenyl synthetase family protein [Bremerella volcania]UBM37409.1 polyprenyl synthetase family protein [Bremerella volcania]
MNPANQTPAAPSAEALMRCYGGIGSDLAEVEAILKREMSSKFPKVSDIVSYGYLLGGKRLRPALLLLCGQAFGEVTADHHKLGAVMEMVHTATLIHDDVLDGAETRRHLETIHQRWGTESSVLVGDFLFTHAFYLASTLPTTMAARKIGQATNVVCEGELRQITTKGRFDLKEEEYLSIIEAKTAVLCQCACELGAIYANASEEASQQAAEYGRCLGIAFQIVDDLLDIEGDSDRTGKTLGTDLAQRKPTLPIIHALKVASEETKAEMLSALEAEEPDVAQVMGWIEEFDSAAYARETAIRYVETALAAISQWPEGDATTALRQLAEFVLKRCY